MDLNDFNTRLDDLSISLNTSITIDENDQLRGARGGYFLNENKILLNNGNTPTQNIKTSIHELAHAKLHHLKSDRYNDSKAIQETQAEMIAYIVCKYFGIDTTQYSLKYIANWSNKLTAINQEDLIPVFEEIQKTAKLFITQLTSSPSIEKIG